MLTHKDKHAILALVSLRCSKLSTLDIASKYYENRSRQVFISHASGDANFEGFWQITDERSTLVVKGYACIKEERKQLF